ncbi:ester cyclase [Kineosporia sp. J2-2]|uniref:Ester cyclase n=1 Tax=Kineosporia corallincola TaxID=2835133 RepID=A0ABS5TSD5_9ACTN|nr:ester cyclase [Kineosporia corallincola]MBT0773679.1 ester cyclase [Kineosporia corallincola]
MASNDLHEFYAEYVAVLNHRELHRLDEFVNDEITYFGDRATREQVIAAITAEIEAVPDLSWEVRDFAVDGVNLAARLVNKGTPVKPWLGVEPTGKSFEITEFAVYRTLGGRYTHMANLHDSELLKKQLHG